MKNSWLYKVISWLVALLLPIALVLTSVRFLLTPVYINIEYNIPGFPPDPYGFTQKDRLYYANIDRLYLLNDAGISFIGDLQFPDGQLAPPESCRYMTDCTRLYNDRELKHMVDVKIVVKAALKVWLLSLVALLILGIWARYGGWWIEYRRGLSRGGWLTLVMIGAVLLLVLVAFGVFFVAFHNVFFASGTWTFFYSDTLIRLFPERFWRDIFLVVGILSGGLGLALGYFMRVKAIKD